MNEMPIADILTIELLNGIQFGKCDTMRTHMFTMDIEKVSKSLDIELPVEIFIDQFAAEIVETSGYKGFSSFCEIDMDAIRDLGSKAYTLLS